MEAVNTYFKVIDLTRLRIKRESAAPEADALFNRPSELYLTRQHNRFVVYLSNMFIVEC